MRPTGSKAADRRRKSCLHPCVQGSGSAAAGQRRCRPAGGTDRGRHGAGAGGRLRGDQRSVQARQLAARAALCHRGHRPLYGRIRLVRRRPVAGRHEGDGSRPAPGRHSRGHGGASGSALRHAAGRLWRHGRQVLRPERLEAGQPADRGALLPGGGRSGDGGGERGRRAGRWIGRTPGRKAWRP